MQLKTTIKTTMEQILHAVASLSHTHSQPSPNAMEMEAETSTREDKDGLKEHDNKKQFTIDIADLVQDLKYEIATIVTESQALFKQQLLLTSTNNPNSPPVRTNQSHSPVT